MIYFFVNQKSEFKSHTVHQMIKAEKQQNVHCQINNKLTNQHK